MPLKVELPFEKPNVHLKNYTIYVRSIALDCQRIYKVLYILIGKPPEAGICKAIKTLTGHKKRVNTLCWSPHIDAHLASGARDGVVQVCSKLFYSAFTLQKFSY